jgi:hypothetical protein
LACPSKTKTTYKTNKLDTVTEKIHEIIQVKVSEKENLDVITIPMISLKIHKIIINKKDSVQK